MIGSWEMENKTQSELFFDLGFAYMDTSILSTKSMLNNQTPSQYSQSRVILSLAYHAIELFLKGAILFKKNEYKVNGHNLDTLYKEYQKLYTQDKFQLESPFITRFMGISVDEINSINLPPRDQMYRYHTDRNTEKWEGVEGFIPQDFLKKSSSLKNKFIELKKRIKKSHPIVSDYFGQSCDLSKD
jgi:hypothetical protein